AAFIVLRSDGFVLVRSRPPRGLLGGMTEVPTTQWTHDFDGGQELAPRLGRAQPSWRRIAGVVTHTFTHFPLELVVYVAEVSPKPGRPSGGGWAGGGRSGGGGLPHGQGKGVGGGARKPPPDPRRWDGGGPAMEFTRRNLTAAAGATAATTFTRTALGGWE